MPDIQPKWFEQISPETSWRSVFKWGSPGEFKHPNAGLTRMMKATFGMTDEDFRTPRNLGLEPATFDCPSKLAPSVIADFQAMLGPDNVSTDDLSRLRVAYGKVGATHFNSI